MTIPTRATKLQDIDQAGRLKSGSRRRVCQRPRKYTIPRTAPAPRDAMRYTVSVMSKPPVFPSSNRNAESVPLFFHDLISCLLHPVPAVHAAHGDSGNEEHQGPGIAARKRLVDPEACRHADEGGDGDGPAHYAEHPESEPDRMVLRRLALEPAGLLRADVLREGLGALLPSLPWGQLFVTHIPSIP